MPYFPIFIVSFVIIIIVLFFVMRNSTLNKIEYIENENILYEESKIKISAKTGSKTTIFINSKVIFTNFRLIICQKMLLQNNYQIHYILWFENNFSEKFPIKKGILNMNLGKDNIKLIEEKNKKYIELIPDGAHGMVGKINIYTKNPEKFIK